MKIVRLIRNTTCLVLFLCLLICSYLLWSSLSASGEQSSYMADIACYKPQQSITNLQSEKKSEEANNNVPSEKSVVNQSIIDLQTKYPDVLGWLTFDNTSIDYPFVQSRDNNDYLRHDLDGNYLVAGTIFADCRCDIYSSFLTIIYGHYYRNGFMFGDLKKYADSEFWAENTTGTLYLPYGTYQMQIIAYLVVNSSDPEIYSPDLHTESDVAHFQEYISQNARRYRDTDLTANDRVLALSTCNFEFTGARSVLIVKLVSNSNFETQEQN